MVEKPDKRDLQRKPTSLSSGPGRARTQTIPCHSFVQTIANHQPLLLQKCGQLLKQLRDLVATRWHALLLLRQDLRRLLDVLREPAHVALLLVLQDVAEVVEFALEASLEVVELLLKPVESSTDNWDVRIRDGLLSMGSRPLVTTARRTRHGFKTGLEVVDPVHGGLENCIDVELRGGVPARSSSLWEGFVMFLRVVGLWILERDVWLVVNTRDGLGELKSLAVCLDCSEDGNWGAGLRRV
jgi:hypothetical protein